MERDNYFGSDYKEIYSKVISSTNNGQVESGILQFNNLGDANLALSILEDYYSNVSIRDLDENNEEDGSYYVLYSNDMEEDFDKLKFSPNLNPEGTPIGRWSGMGFAEDLEENWEDPEEGEECPVCGSHMEYVGGQGVYNEYFCDMCNKYYYEDPQDRIQGEEVWENMRSKDDIISPLLEGYWDCTEDSFFTRDDLMEFEDELQSQLQDILPDIHVYRAYMEPGNRLEVDWDYMGYDDTSKVRVDMRHIRKPSDLLDYVKHIREDIIDKCQEYDSYNESYSVVDLDTGDKFGRYDDTERARTKALQYMKMFNAPNTAIVDTDTDKPLYRVRTTGNLEKAKDVNEERYIDESDSAYICYGFGYQTDKKKEKFANKLYFTNVAICAQTNGFWTAGGRTLEGVIAQLGKKVNPLAAYKSEEEAKAGVSNWISFDDDEPMTWETFTPYKTFCGDVFIIKLVFNDDKELVNYEITDAHHVDNRNKTDESVDEAVEKHDTLNQKIFDGDELLPEVKDKLLEIVDNFKNNLEQDGIKLDIKDVRIIGSNASYNYTAQSDIDLHIYADLSVYPNQEELAEKVYMAYKSLWNNKFDPVVKGHQVEIYVEPYEG